MGGGAGSRLLTDVPRLKLAPPGNLSGRAARRGCGRRQWICSPTKPGTSPGHSTTRATAASYSNPAATARRGSPSPRHRTGTHRIGTLSHQTDRLRSAGPCAFAVRRHHRSYRIPTRRRRSPERQILALRWQRQAPPVTALISQLPPPGGCSRPPDDSAALRRPRAAAARAPLAAETFDCRSYVRKARGPVAGAVCSGHAPRWPRRRVRPRTRCGDPPRRWARAQRPVIDAS